jgi:hypothetical protein
MKAGLKDDNILQHHFHSAKTLVYDNCGFDFCELIAENGSQEYGARTFRLNGLKIKFSDNLTKLTLDSYCY